jgi:hypothetical protein
MKIPFMGGVEQRAGSASVSLTAVIAVVCYRPVARSTRCHKGGCVIAAVVLDVGECLDLIWLNSASGSLLCHCSVESGDAGHLNANQTQSGQ